MGDGSRQGSREQIIVWAREARSQRSSGIRCIGVRLWCRRAPSHVHRTLNAFRLIGGHRLNIHMIETIRQTSDYIFSLSLLLMAVIFQPCSCCN